MNFPEALLDAFRRTTGLRIMSVQDKDGDVWWMEPNQPEFFRCNVGDRVLHIDELSDNQEP